VIDWLIDWYSFISCFVFVSMATTLAVTAKKSILTYCQQRAGLKDIIGREVAIFQQTTKNFRQEEIMDAQNFFNVLCNFFPKWGFSAQILHFGRTLQKIFRQPEIWEPWLSPCYALVFLNEKFVPVPLSKRHWILPIFLALRHILFKRLKYTHTQSLLHKILTMHKNTHAQVY